MTSSNNTTDNEDEWVECPVCGGEGEYEVEYAVVDHMNGGFLAARIEPCALCDGFGRVPPEDAESMLIQVDLEGGNYYH
jgi:DnaJ-class molecular chaperone